MSVICVYSWLPSLWSASCQMPTVEHMFDAEPTIPCTIQSLKGSLVARPTPRRRRWHGGKRTEVRTHKNRGRPSRRSFSGSKEPVFWGVVLSSKHAAPCHRIGLVSLPSLDVPPCHRLPQRGAKVPVCRGDVSATPVARAKPPLATVPPPLRAGSITARSNRSRRASATRRCHRAVARRARAAPADRAASPGCAGSRGRRPPPPAAVPLTYRA